MYLPSSSTLIHFCKSSFRRHSKNIIAISREEKKFTTSATVSNIASHDTKSPRSDVFDLVVVGGGIVGVTTARAALIETPNLKVALLEKENDLALHQSGHNSGVIHAGIYYQPGSLKAKLCVYGMQMMYEFCDAHNIPYKKCGKLIVAVRHAEVPMLKLLYQNALKNNSPDVKVVQYKQIQEIEPYCEGIAAIHSPHTGIVDYATVTKYCAKDFEKRGGKVYCNFKVTKIRECKEGTDEADVSKGPIEFCSENDAQVIRSKHGITCGGLHSDILAEMSSGLPEPLIVPFRGEYLELREDKRHLVKGNIYPVPDPRFPFLGVHFTPRIDGRVLLGPNAVLAFGRENYSWETADYKELRKMWKHFAFRKLVYGHLDYGLKEMWKSYFSYFQYRNLKKYIPSLEREDVVYNGYAGVRAQAVDFDGKLTDDLLLHLGNKGIEKKIIHVRNAPSPAATSSLALAELIVKDAYTEFDY